MADIDPQSVQPDITEDPNFSLDLSCIVVTFVVICLAQQFEDLLIRRGRRQVVFNEREIYFNRLTEESDKINMELSKPIKQLEEEGEKLREQLGDEDCWSNYSTSIDDEVESLDRELENLTNKKNEMQSIDKKIEKVRKLLEDKGADVKGNEELRAEIRRRQSTLDSLRPEFKSEVLRETSEVDPKIVDFLDKHEELTCDTLGQIYSKIIDAKASGIDLIERVENFKAHQADLEKEIADLTVENKEQEIELQNMSDLCKQELTSFLEAEAEHYLKNNSAEVRLEFLKELNTLDEEEIARIKVEIDRKKKQLETERNIFEEAEKQHSKISEEWARMKEMKAEIEASERDMIFLP